MGGNRVVGSGWLRALFSVVMGISTYTISRRPNLWGPQKMVWGRRFAYQIPLPSGPQPIAWRPDGYRLPWERTRAEDWRGDIEGILRERMVEDGAHDLSHVRRVARLAQTLAREDGERVDALVILAGGLLHDLVNLSKDHPQRHLASRLAASQACECLQRLGFPPKKLEAVFHVIEAHSFSAGIQPTTLEAAYVQDADRMEALGALGLLRWLYISGRMGSLLYSSEDPLGAMGRELDDRTFALDHLELKLFSISSTMQTKAGRSRAELLTEPLRVFRQQLWLETLQVKTQGPAHRLAAVVRRGSAEGKPLFHQDDPFARLRRRDPEKYIMDEVLTMGKEPFIEDTIRQLANEMGEGRRWKNTQDFPHVRWLREWNGGISPLKRWSRPI